MKKTIRLLGLAVLPLCADAEFQNDVKIPMRDGVNLAGDIYLPSNRTGKVEESYDSKGFPDAFYIDITSVAAEKERLIRLYACQNADDAMCKKEMRNSRMRAGRLWPPRLDGYAEAFAPYVGRPQGPCIFSEIPRDPIGDEMPEWGR